MPRHSTPQFELPGTADAFNLAGETAIDGERIQREQLAAEANSTVAKRLEMERQRCLEICLDLQK